MRKALIVGINYYESISKLYGCVNDARSVSDILMRNEDKTKNFDIKLLTATCESNAITRNDIKDDLRSLFSDQAEIALFYFAGHGFVETTGGYLCASDCKRGDDGFALSEVLHFANESKAQNKIIVLDSCHAGIAGQVSNTSGYSELSEGLTILTASTAEQYAEERNGEGVFTTLFVDALNGAAANLVGDITPGSIYAHIDQSLGSWEQRPIFKTNIKKFVSLRKVLPPISLAELHRLTELFPTPGYEFRLDPTFEPESEYPNPINTEIFAVLQKYNRVNLLKPFGAPHMYHAAMNSESCKLTALGEHYRRLVDSQKI